MAGSNCQENNSLWICEHTEGALGCALEIVAGACFVVVVGETLR